MRYLRNIWAFNDVSSDSQTNRKRSFIDKHLCLWSWQYRHFFLFKQKTQICRKLMINRLMHRTHIKFDDSICENALRSCIDVENDERTLRNVMIKISIKMRKLIANEYFTRSRWCDSNEEITRKIKKSKNDEWKRRFHHSLYLRVNHCLHSLNRIHYKISQQINVIILQRVLDYLAKSTLFVV
jgi:hypothetical protein